MHFFNTLSTFKKENVNSYLCFKEPFKYFTPIAIFNIPKLAILSKVLNQNFLDCIQSKY